MKAPWQRVVTLGPEGTFSDKAAQHCQTALTEGSPPLRYERTIPATLTAAEEDPSTLAVIPIENSVAGTVIPTQDGLMRRRVRILAEVQLAVDFALLVTPQIPLESVEVLLAHPQAEAQCERFIAAHLRQVHIEYADSNIAAARRFLGTPPTEQRSLAVITPLDFGRQHPELLRAERIQDVESNTTRFLALCQAGKHLPPWNWACQKTSLLIEPHEDRPGLLHEILSVFHAARINLTRLESRPSRLRRWNYVFFIDFDNNPHSEVCIRLLRETPNRITVLGSYNAIVPSAV